MEAYPFTIRSILRASKSRSQPASFSTADPRRGPAYSQRVGTDVPVIWETPFLFTPDEAVAFVLWGEVKLNNWVDEFTMPIRTEFGLIDYVCKFLADGVPNNPREDGGNWRYSGRVWARKLIVPDAFKDAADLIIGLPNWRLWADYLDETVNEAMPEA